MCVLPSGSCPGSKVHLTNDRVQTGPQSDWTLPRHPAPDPLDMLHPLVTLEAPDQRILQSGCRTSCRETDRCVTVRLRPLLVYTEPHSVDWNTNQPCRVREGATCNMAASAFNRTYCQVVGRSIKTKKKSTFPNSDGEQDQSTHKGELGS